MEYFMALYLWLTAWFFILLGLGLRKDSIYLAEIWPRLPEDKKLRRDQLTVLVLVLVSFVLLWFLTAFRSSEIGNDTKNYLISFGILRNSFSDKFLAEYGYQLLNIIINQFTHDKHAFLIIMATIMYGGLGFYIYKYSKNPAVSLCIFFGCFFSSYLCIFRQGIAMIIVLYGYEFLKRGKKIPAALLFLLATTFHTTALVAFLLFLDLKIFGKRWFVFSLAALCAIVSRLGVFETLVDMIVPRYTHYFHSKYASSGWLAITYYILLYAVIYYLISASLIEEERSDRTVAANFTFLLFFTAFGYAVNLFDRVGEYFLLIGVTEIPNMLYRGKVKHFRLWLFGVCAVMLIMFVLILIYRPGWNHMYPYEFWPDSIFAAWN